MFYDPKSLPRPVVELIKDLRRGRKAALRECGRLGDKLHTSRLEIEVLRSLVKKLENDLDNVGSATLGHRP